MVRDNFNVNRSLRSNQITTDFLVVGGGISGICAALAAARAGIKVVLIQDRPVLGGNASSEVRLWILGATSHMGNNNRWAREGGIVDEILVENLYRNKEGNPLIFDTILLEKVYQEKNITLLLNTVVYEVEKKDEKNIRGVRAFCSQNSIMYEVSANLFCDASGDGILGFLAGASFRMGAETRAEFEEGFAPDVKDYGELLGHSIYFYTKKNEQAVKYVPPTFAHKDVGSYKRIRNYKLQEDGCRLWWVEYGGRLDTIHESENIKWELWKVIYGLWDHVKNSGQFPEAENLTLEWVVTFPGMRASRRFEGDYMLLQPDVVEQRRHEDAVAFGGWAMDLHPADGVYSDKSGCTQWHSKGVYQIPYRCYYSKDIENLFLAGRIISVSHVAFSSTRVMATCGLGGQAVGTAAALATKLSLKPRDIGQKHIKELQLNLNKTGDSIPFFPIDDPDNLAVKAQIKVSSTLELSVLPDNGEWLPLSFSSAQMLPFLKETLYQLNFTVNACESTTLRFELRCSSKVHNHTPDVVLEVIEFKLSAGEQQINIKLKEVLSENQYAFLCFIKNDLVSIKCSQNRVSGLLTVINKTNKAVSNYGRQDPPHDIGVDSFEFWTPYRRPKGQNFAFSISPSISCYPAENLTNGFLRPSSVTNSWTASLEDERPFIRFEWPSAVSIRKVIIFMDNDFDHPLESSLHGHPEDRLPFCIKNYELSINDAVSAFREDNNYQTVNTINFDVPLFSDNLTITLNRPSSNIPASIFEVLIYD